MSDTIARPVPPPPSAPVAAGPEVEVLVVGAGPVGLALAADLLRRGTAVRIIDAAAEPSSTSRATSLTPRTLEVLDDLGALDDLLADGVRISRTDAFAGDRLTFRLEFPTTDTTRYPYLLNNSQAETEAALTSLVGRLGGVVERGVELVGLAQDRSGVTGQLRAAGGGEHGPITQVRAAWLVAADGGRSLVRKTLAIPFPGEAIPETIVLGDVTLDWDRPADRIYSWFSGDGALLAFPFTTPGRWRLTTTLAPGEVQAYAEGSLSGITALYRQRTGDMTTRLSELHWYSAFVANQRVAGTFRRGRVLLAGDAAHVHTPAGGLGMNTGIQDAYNLAWKLALVCAGAAEDSLLDTYEQERRPIAEALLSSTGNLQKIYSIRSRTAQNARDTALRTLLDLPPLRRAFFVRAGQLDLAYPRSDLNGPVPGPGRSRRTTVRRQVRAGDRAPDGPAVEHGTDPATGRSTTVHEQLRGTGPVLLLFAGVGGGQGISALGDLARRAAQQGLGLRVVVVTAGGHGSVGDLVEHATVLHDPTGVLHRRYGAARTGGRPSAHVIRPDGHIGLVSAPLSDEAVLAYLPMVTGDQTARAGAAARRSRDG